jgi:hypothetical protein
MRRVSNLAFNRKFTERTGVVGFGAGSGVQIRRDRDNPYTLKTDRNHHNGTGRTS